MQPGMFGADAGIVESGGDAVRLGDLTVLVLEQIGFVAVEDAGAAAGEAGGVAPVEPFARGLDADDLDPRIVEEGMEQADRVGAAADRGDQHVGQAAFRLQYRSEEHTSELQSLMRISY